MLKQPDPTPHKTTLTEITSLFGDTKLILDETPKPKSLAKLGENARPTEFE